MLHAAIDSRIDDLLALVSQKESAKTAALEMELERLDKVLELTRREHAAVREAIESKCDDELTVVSADLTARLEAIDALLDTLPHGPVEQSLLRVDLDLGDLLSTIRTAGIVLAPRGIRATDVVVRGLPTHVRPGRPLQFDLALSDENPIAPPLLS